ncbi:MAG: DUF3488 and transglutaminase-like domain-containing protein [Anaerolineae bacterium]|nr:DUF3488 and transglutaminase-like domain-containing protein [Anaerolineae bacterium]
MEARSSFGSLFDPDAGSRWGDWLAALYLLAALSTAAGRVVATNWTEHLILLQTVSFWGGVVGLLLGQSRFLPLPCFLLGSAYGLFLIPWQLGLTLKGDLLWPQRVLLLRDRLWVALDQFVAREPVRDPLLFLTLMAILFWGMSVGAGYVVARRGDPWRALIPPGLTSVVVQIYDPVPPSRIWILALYIFFALLLISRLAYLRYQRKWRTERVILPPFLGLDWGRFALRFVLIVVLLAWALPAPRTMVQSVQRAWENVARPWTRFRERISNLFEPLEGGALVPVGEYYGPQLALGQSALLGDIPLLRVKGPSPPPGVAYYWRARVYDTYRDGLWVEHYLSVQPFAGVTQPETEGRWPAVFTYTTLSPLSLLYLAPQPVWVDVPVRADLYSSDPPDVAALHADPPLRAGETYRAGSLLTAATAAQLRAAGTDYPAWVTERYLQLPSDITPRTRALAQEIARGKETPYDIAVAITEYLRYNIRYSPRVPEPPRGRELVDWFLFDHRRGFCTYYATAEVVLLRSLGIPARLAVGFARGEWDLQTGAYLVRERDAHAWPEVYFPGVGWVEFEPTAIQPEIIRPSGESLEEQELLPQDWMERRLARLEEMEEPGEGEPTPPRLPPPSPQRRLFPWAWLAGTAGLLLMLLAARFRRRVPFRMSPFPVLLERGIRQAGLEPPPLIQRWAYEATLPEVARAYLELNRALSRLGVPAGPGETPAERGARLVRLLPETTEAVRQLLEEYQGVTYGTRLPDPQRARQAARAIRHLSQLARLRWILRKKQKSSTAATQPLW